MSNDGDEFLSLYEIKSLSPARPFSYVERPTFVQAPFWYLVHTALLLLIFGTLLRVTPKNYNAVLSVLSLSLLSSTELFVRYMYESCSANDRYCVTNDYVEVASGRLYKETRYIHWSHVHYITTRISLFQGRFGTGDILLHLTLAISAVETGASLALGASGSLSNRRTRGETVTLKDVERVGVKVQLMRELIAAKL